ncbi:energy transducer TonB [Lichenihabitans psoromatis]|uniref:energy transducer TonB n=1 Tax=Lichenihabitans psoromatis TaxID=2528642 RepID=UPI0010366AB0|nr:TonB family protein [Lichenihabitans psoromatis]
MLTGDLRAIREDRLDLSIFSAAPALTDAPEHLFVAPVPEARTSRLTRLVSSTTISAIVHLALVVAFVILWRAMLVDLTSSEPISVEVVKSIPGESSTSPSFPEAKPEPKPAAVQPEPPKPAAAQPEPPKPEALPPVPGTTPSQTAEPSNTDGKDAVTSKQDVKAPVLVAPPPEPTRAETQTDKNEPANLSEDKPKDPAPPQPVKAPDAPAVLTSPQADTSVPAPARNPEPAERKPPVAPSHQSSTDQTARLAAALPMSAIGLPSTFRAMLSSAGQAESQEYKGVVYGMLGREQQLIEQARAKGLRGQVILALTVGDTGAVDRLAIIQSSGQPEVDAMALDLVRKAAPFPAPPPGTTRSFNPALTFGEQ